MKQLLHATTAYRAYSSGEPGAAALVLFQDEPLLRPLLKECAKAFFGGEERICRLIEEESFSDCIFLPAAGGKLTVDDAARIIDESILRPVEGTKKLFVLDGFHRASVLVQNKLLKVLEEPPAGVHFLLGATAEHAVLPTVLSRVQKLAVPPFSEEEIYAALTRAYAGSAGLKEAAAGSGGVYSAAERLVKGGGEEFRLARQLLALEDSEKLCRALGERSDKESFLAALRLTLHDILLVQAGRGERAALPATELTSLARRYPTGVLLAAQRFLRDAEREVRFNANLGQCAYAFTLKLKKELETWQKLS